MSRIASIQGFEILDSRGRPTVACGVRLQGGALGYAGVPSGASTGRFEAVELRDGDSSRYQGLGVLKAVEHIDTLIGPALVGMEAADQEALDARLIELDGQPDKSHLGANALLAVSLAAAQAASVHQGVPLYRYLAGDTLEWHQPIPLMNVLNGGVHASNALDIQEVMLVPVAAPSFAEAVRWGAEIQMTLHRQLREAGQSTSVGDEGGVAPQVCRVEEALTLLCQAIEGSGYRLGEQVALALDVASSAFYQDGQYRLPATGETYDRASWCAYWKALTQTFPIISLEDAMAEDDWAGWTALTEALGDRVQLVGDDLFVTQVPRLRRGFDEKAGNAILIKPNQVGTLTECLETVTLAQRADFGVVFSHRSGETEDAWLADLTVATQAGQIKTGALCRGERLAKYNRLMGIERALT